MNYKIPVSVLVILFTREYEILLLERADRPGFWQSVTGSKKAEEELLLETAKREVEEETGVISDSNRFLNWGRSFEFEIFQHWRNRYEPGVRYNTEHVFSLQVDKQANIKISPREHLSSCWVSRSEAIAKVFSWTNAIALRELPNYHAIENM